MLYCFVKGTLNHIFDNELYIQAEYAKKIGRFVMLDLRKHGFYNEKGKEIDIKDRFIFLRTDYEHIDSAMICVENNSGILLENNQHRNAIRNWFYFYSPIRKLAYITGADVLCKVFDDKIKNILQYSKQLFIKSTDKGFSSVINSSDLYENSSEIVKIIKKREKVTSNDYLISEKVDFVRDCHGNLEVRFVVLKNKLVNWSRYIHSLKHSVNPNFIRKANEFVGLMSYKKEFPQNYVMDLGLMISHKKSYIDIVEFNPISTSLCYVNNSIFDTKTLHFNKNIETHGFGVEYYFDMMKFPANYHLTYDGKSNFTYSIR